MRTKTVPLRATSDYSFSETLNFLITNRIPRAASTRLMGKLSRVRNPLFTKIALKIWKTFSEDMRLDEASTQEFATLHDCFTRQLKAEARHVANAFDAITSPCDAIVGAHGSIQDFEVLQVKGLPYQLSELVHDSIDLERYRNGRFVTLRIKSSMYHHIHAPASCSTEKIHYISGDTWNVNPATLKRVDKLFCRNERAVIELDLNQHQGHIALVPVAAILVASMRFKGLAYPLNLQYRGTNTLPHENTFDKGERLGNFEHGSTIVMLTSKDFSFLPNIKEEQRINMGEALMQAHLPVTQSKQG